MSPSKYSLDDLKTEAHIWIASPDSLSDKKAVIDNLGLLNETEKARYHRYIFDKDRISFLAAHALLRRTLSLYAPVEAENWTFDTNKYGRPEISGDHAALNLRFNLSHSKLLVACIITSSRDCGIDVESYGRLEDPVSITKRFFTDQEYRALLRYPAESRDRYFTKLWTLKEAYVKTLGQGLSASLKGAIFDLSPGDNVRVTFAKNDKAEQPNWNFHAEQPDDNHMLSAAVRCLDAGRIEFHSKHLDLGE